MDLRNLGRIVAAVVAFNPLVVFHPKKGNH
jgi:hypothetical protein